MKLELLCFTEVLEAHPERYEKADLLETSIVQRDPGRWIVKRTPSSEAHVVELATIYDEFFGKCSCKGFEHHDGPCSHLSALHRAEAQDMIDVPRARPETVTARIVSKAEAQAATAAEAVTDGGQRLERSEARRTPPHSR